MAYERRKGRTPSDVRTKSIGYDVLSEGNKGKRCIEIKSRSSERQTFVEMRGGLLRRLGKDVLNYYLYLVRNVESDKPTLRVVPPERVLSNLSTEVRFRFAITRKSLEGIKEIAI